MVHTKEPSFPKQSSLTRTHLYQPYYNHADDVSEIDAHVSINLTGSHGHRPTQTTWAAHCERWSPISKHVMSWTTLLLINCMFRPLATRTTQSLWDPYYPFQFNKPCFIKHHFYFFNINPFWQVHMDELRSCLLRGQTHLTRLTR